MNLQNTRSSFLKQHAAMREPHSRREFQFQPYAARDTRY
jgi:hypothetical protein